MTERREKFETLASRVEEVVRLEGEGVRTLEVLRLALTMDDLAGILYARERLKHLEFLFRVSADSPTFAIGEDDPAGFDEI